MLFDGSSDFQRFDWTVSADNILFRELFSEEITGKGELFMDGRLVEGPGLGDPWWAKDMTEENELDKSSVNEAWWVRGLWNGN